VEASSFTSTVREPSGIVKQGVLATSRDYTKDQPSVELRGSDLDRQDKIFRDCDEYLRDSRRLRDIAKLKVSGKTPTGCLNPLKSMKTILKGKKGIKVHPQTEGIKQSEIERTKSAEECLRSAWPPERKGNHRVKDCIRPIKLNTGTAGQSLWKRFQESCVLSSDKVE